MTPAAKILYSSMLLVGLIIGAVLGFWSSSNLLRMQSEVRWDIAPSALQDFSYAQYKYADTEHARVALQNAANLLEEMEGLHPDRSQKGGLAIIYTRLALLEDADQNVDSSQADMTKARHWRTASGDKDITDSEMKSNLTAFAKAMDSVRK